MDEAVAERQDLARLVEAHFDVVDLAPLLVGGQQVLTPVLRPLHGPTERDRRVRDQDLLRIEEHDLRAEAAAHVRRHDFDAELGKAEEPRQAVLDGQRRLRRVPDSQDPSPRVPLGHHAARLDGAAAAALDRQPLAPHARRPPQRPGGVADRLPEPRGAVLGHVGVHARRAGRERGRQVGHDRKRLVLDLDQRGRVLGEVAIGRDDECDELAHVSDLVGREWPLRARVSQRGMRDQQRRRLVPLTQVGRGEHQADAGRAAGGGRVDPNDPRVGVAAPQRRPVEHARRVHVVHEAPEALQQPRILVARNARADRACAHQAADRPMPACTSASSARSKQARGALTIPAPTWPTPASRCAMPVVI